MKLSKELFRKRFDSSIIEPDATDARTAEFIRKCLEYRDYFAALAFNLHQIPLAVEMLKGTGVDVCCPISYPLGNLPIELELSQVEFALENQVQQIDCAMPLELFRSGNYAAVKEHMDAIVAAARPHVKFISFIPTFGHLANDEQKLRAARMIRDAGADIIKTNAGFGLLTKVEDVKMVKQDLGDSIMIMASGGVRDLEGAWKMFDAGASRIATSTPFEIFEGLDRLLESN